MAPNPKPQPLLNQYRHWDRSKKSCYVKTVDCVLLRNIVFSVFSLQIRAEFRRIITPDLLESFLDGLDGLIPRLLEVYKAATKSGKKQSLKDILDCLVKDDTNERRRVAALLGLPHYISGEDPSAVVRMCDAHVDTLDDALKGIQLGLLIACEGGERSAIPHEVFDVAVVVEETIVLHNIKDVAQCFAMLMGVIYCVNLKYPDDMTYSFKFLQ
ncbi:uncharacterized protein LOC119617371 [Kryptolebias marmoratus]|uniref:uncharacterized protein LOC119617371 n=1 Tax=Kryptolebias marmoratus TaxID=37003 RepID=UPI0018ACEFCE|nr:uncharacterized protein LOC119617371 [Kryptolebias marmoratus]